MVDRAVVDRVVVDRVVVDRVHPGRAATLGVAVVTQAAVVADEVAAGIVAVAVVEIRRPVPVLSAWTARACGPRISNRSCRKTVNQYRWSRALACWKCTLTDTVFCDRSRPTMSASEPIHLCQPR